MFLASVSPYNFAPPIQNEFLFAGGAFPTDFTTTFAGAGVTFTSSTASTFPMEVDNYNVDLFVGQTISFPMEVQGP